MSISSLTPIILSKQETRRRNRKQIVVFFNFPPQFNSAQRPTTKAVQTESTNSFRRKIAKDVFHFFGVLTPFFFLPWEVLYIFYHGVFGCCKAIVIFFWNSKGKKGVTRGSWRGRRMRITSMSTRNKMPLSRRLLFRSGNRIVTFLLPLEESRCSI